MLGVREGCMITAKKKIIYIHLTMWSPLWLICGTILFFLSHQKTTILISADALRGNEMSKYFYYYQIMNRGKWNNLQFNVYLSGHFNTIWPLIVFVRRSKPPELQCRSDSKRVLHPNYSTHMTFLTSWILACLDLCSPINLKARLKKKIFSNDKLIRLFLNFI